MAHIDPTKNLDTATTKVAADIDGDPVAYIPIVVDGQLCKITAEDLATAVAAFNA